MTGVAVDVSISLRHFFFLTHLLHDPKLLLSPLKGLCIDQMPTHHQITLLITFICCWLHLYEHTHHSANAEVILSFHSEHPGDQAQRHQTW